ncbi:hypothetical protein B0H10DRAFT_2022652 [Mycena sp. CBHHK59/15]|nr:hypothetical protein B0H10DRAFT_2022652 [Mycena sp. CBHHK59/15]
MTPRSCIFFLEGRCRYGPACRFSHSPPQVSSVSPAASTSNAPPSSTTKRKRDLSPAPLPAKKAKKSAGAAVANPQLIDTVNSLRASNGLQALEKSDKFFEVLENVICSDDDIIECATDALREMLPYGLSSGESSDGSGSDDSLLNYRVTRSRPTAPKYVEPKFSDAQTVRYTTNDRRVAAPFDWKPLENPTILNVQFGANFDITDAHIQGLAARPALCRRLERFSAGDSDTGHGHAVQNEAAFIRFVELCSSLCVLRLEAFTRLTDATLLAVFAACPRIESVHLSGNDKVRGGVVGTALKTLAQTPYLAPALKSLALYDQSVGSVRALSAARPALWIFTGETLGDGIADNMIAAMTGGASVQTWLGGQVVSADVDFGVYGPSGHELPW